MEAHPRDVQIYLTREGKAPFSDWLESLKDDQARGNIRARINRVRLGNFGDCKSVGEGVSELRIDFGPGYRVYFGQEGTKIVILLCGGDKSSQAGDIRKAQEYWADYRNRDDA
ncbi:MAG: type II toxin-antitoxin system RelE/ParE family toxin [Candidatus Tectomicrobia bacterium]|uniref:Type II toxin-antitoxin system RelE/ParE family toxin n=1 Tax=Tectimicrobiota bacterium TaxID=2528274 RepID=A0A932FXH6_UNCTE|nr:type II toxin-antitoxin system RelE/ParE family toxin [Candidatus Tectomicrobia bacterium]